MEAVSKMVLAAALAAGVIGPVQAGTARRAEAVLAVSHDREARAVIDGRAWRCLGTGCRGGAVSAPKSQPVVAECQSVAAQFGALALYRSGSRELSAEELDRCNTKAAARPSPEVLARTR